MAKVVFVPGPNSHQFQKREIKVLEEVKVSIKYRVFNTEYFPGFKALNSNAQFDNMTEYRLYSVSNS